MPDAAGNRELILTRTLNASRANVYRAWTEPALLKQWFAPKPYETTTVELDLRPGGASLIVMRAPDGAEFPNRGVYLELIPNVLLVFTDAYTSAWEPSAKPFMTVSITLADAPNDRTLYTARVLHWTTEDRDRHEQMGFHQGWGICATQLEAVAASLSHPESSATR